MIDNNTKILHLRRVRSYFAQLPPLQPATVDIILRSHLNVPEALLPQAREAIDALHQPTPELRKSA